jgi:hypothetical protein
VGTQVTYQGIIKFDPKDRTTKHKSQSSWKKMALVVFDGDISEYYAWFIAKRYNLKLNPPLRGAHVSFINDSHRDLGLNGGDIEKAWITTKNKWDNKKIDITLDLDVRTDGTHWWLPLAGKCREELHGIRAELGLSKPFWGLHMSLGYANNKNMDHSNYIHRLIKKGLIK